MLNMIYSTETKRETKQSQINFNEYNNNSCNMDFSSILMSFTFNSDGKVYAQALSSA